MDDVFSYLLPHLNDDDTIRQKRLAHALWFVNNFPESEFEGEELVMYKLLHMASKYGIIASDRYVSVFCATELKPLIAKKNIRIDGLEGLKYEEASALNTATEQMKALIYEEYDRLSNIDECVPENFASELIYWMDMQLNKRLVSVYSHGFEMMGNMERGQIGASDALSYTKMKIDSIYAIYDKTKLEELAYATPDANRVKFVTDTGLPTIDKDSLGFYTTQLVGIEAPPGEGKTRFANGVIGYRAATIYKQNVAIYAAEQNWDEIESLYVSRHVYELYAVVISDSLIRYKKVPDDLIDLVESARFDLFESDKYGAIHIYSDVICYDTMISKFKINDSKVEGGYHVIIIDHMSLLEQSPPSEGQYYIKRLDQWQRTSEGFKICKRYARAAQKLIIAINQLNAKGSDAAKRGEDSGVSGGSGGMETYRSTDYNMVISSTKEMQVQHKRRIYNPKKRSSEGFDGVICQVTLACCYWKQIIDKQLKSKR